MITTPCPGLNIALGGHIEGGLTSGVTVMAGPSKNFKSGFCLFLASIYLNKYPDAVCMFYDSEFGMPRAYFDQFSIDPNRVLHNPITDIEQLTQDVVKQLDNLKRGDRVIFVIDSVGNIPSKKELADTLDAKSVTDMTRAKAIKSFFRMTTGLVGMKDIPFLVVNHTYREIGTMFPKEIMSGGTGIYYSADTIWFLGRRQEKDGGELTGFNFVINVEKSRFTKEKSQIPINVSFEDGLQKWAGLFDIAIELGFIDKQAAGWYTLKNDTAKFRRSAVEYDDGFWGKVIDDAFREAVKLKYKLNYKGEEKC
jgi:RecA/RadA recombinase